MRVAIYTRVSTGEQETSMQSDELRAYVTARSWTIAHEFNEKMSGARTDRPLKNEVMKLARQRKIDAIVVWKLDRWARSLQQVVSDTREFFELGIRFIVPSQGIDTDKSNPTSQLLINVLGAIGEFERGIIHERIQAGVARAKIYGTKSGKSFGRPKGIFNRDHVRELHASGLSVRKIAAKLKLSATVVHKTIKEGKDNV